MTRLHLLLVAALLVTALALVKSAYENRKLFADIHRAEQERDRLTVDFKRLEAEREQQATAMRVDQAAREQLKMRPLTPAVMLFESAAASAPLPQLVTRAPAARPSASAVRGGER